MNKLEVIKQPVEKELSEFKALFRRLTDKFHSVIE